MVLAQPPPTHSAVLCSRSEYFNACLSGAWAEAAERRVEVTVEDEQAVEDLRLLVKLSYTYSYASLDRRLLPLDQRLRLALLVDRFAFEGAVAQVVESLPEKLDLEGTVALLQNLPPQLEQHPAMAESMAKIIAALPQLIEKREQGARLERLSSLPIDVPIYIDEDVVFFPCSVAASNAGVVKDTGVVKMAVDALAQYLGPVAGMFEEG